MGCIMIPCQFYKDSTSCTLLNYIISIVMDLIRILFPSEEGSRLIP